MEETGERMIPEYHNQRTFYVEHMARYFFACQFVKDKTVLDIACGSGYGTKLLADAGAQTVIGVDNACEAVDYAKKWYNADTIQFILGDALQIPIADHSIDVIVSFETIEHVTAPETFLQECKRVLTPDGLLIASTPNKGTYPSGNQFHVKEFTFREYNDLLKPYFRNTKIVFQNNWFASALLESAPAMNARVAKEQDNMFIANIDPSTAHASLYLVNISCDGPLPSEMRLGSILSVDHEGQGLQKRFETASVALQNRDALVREMYNSESWKIGHRIITTLKRIKSMFWKEHSSVRGKATHGMGDHTSDQQGAYREFLVEQWNGGAMVFPASSNTPDVSIIMPAYNNAQYTMNCLQSIIKYTNSVSYEVIVVNDCSEDKTAVLLRNVKNLKILSNKSNLGFVESCNAGARVSRGKYLFFLNNDTIVTQHWLEPLLGVIEGSDTVGAVGSKLVYPSGMLQEAGGIIWSDATGLNYGRNDNPDKPEYNFVREVDYCSGAALLVKKDLFEKIGGFDEQFTPGYYEDTDLCFSIRKIGYTVIYQPTSTIIHFEGMANGTDVRYGKKRYQEIHRGKFYTKWKDVLVKEQYAPGNADVLWLARTRNEKNGKHILIIDRYVPEFDVDAGSLRMFHTMKLLKEIGHTVTFIGDDLGSPKPYTGVVQQCGVEVISAPFIQSVEEYLATNGTVFDIVLLSRSHIAREHIAAVERYCHKAKIVFNMEDLEYLREMRRAAIENDDTLVEQAQQLKKAELAVAQKCDIVFVISAVEKEYLLKERPHLNVEVVPSIHEPRPTQRPFSERQGIMFLGGFDHLPNVDAVQYFVKTILPLVRNVIPDSMFFIIGSHPTKAIQKFDSRENIVTGWVEDLTPYFDQCRVLVAPLRYGAGVKGKILESMAHGLPIVTTSIGAEGIALEDGHNAMIADAPEEFAAKIVTLYTDEQVWSTCSRNGLQSINDRHSYTVVRARLNEVLRSI